MFKNMGYLKVDHRASPGLTPEQARLAGYDPLLCREGKVYEADTVTCAHCKGSVVLNVFRTRARHACFKCDAKHGKYVCDGCAYLMTLPDYVHVNFQEVV